MNGCCVRFYIHENHRYKNKLAYEWLLEKATEIGAITGSVFRAIDGFRTCDNGHHHDDLMDSIMDMTVMVEVLLGSQEAEVLMEIVRTVGLPLFVTRTSAEFEALNGHADHHRESVPTLPGHRQTYHSI